MQHLLTVSRTLDGFLSSIGRIAAWLLLPMMLVIIVDVITRKFGLLTSAKEFFLASGMQGSHDVVDKYITSTKMQELEWHLHAALFLLCMGFGLSLIHI